MRTVVELMGTTVRLLTGSSGPVKYKITHRQFSILPCTSSSTGSLTSLDNNGIILKAVQVMFAALSIEIIVILNIEMRMFSFTAKVVITTLSPSSICCPLALQVMLLATAVQVNSATPLTEILTARGGIVISADVSLVHDLTQDQTYLLPVRQ